MEHIGVKYTELGEFELLSGLVLKANDHNQRDGELTMHKINGKLYIQQ